MPRGKQLDRSILEAALRGLESRLGDIDEKIGEVKRLLGGRGRPRRQAQSRPGEVTDRPARRKRRVMSAAARKRIADAQKRRWAQFRAQEAKRGSKEAREEAAAPAE